MLLAVLACACSAGTPVSPTPDRDIRAPEAAEDQMADPHGEDRETHESLGQEIETDAEVIQTCENVIGPGRCIRDDLCADFERCLGVGSCETPPCFGICDDYPGTCAPETLTVSCTADEQCPDGSVCTGRVSWGEGPPIGLCRKRPSANACYEDAHCTGGSRCAGEVVCGPERPCLGPEYPGRCVPATGTEGCFEDSDCPPAQVCRGVSWCGWDETDCEDRAGTCEVSNGCLVDADCKDSPDGTFCVGAFQCPQGSKCSIPDTRGYCAPAPGFLQCWSPQQCGDTCRAAFPCGPGTVCAALAKPHPGICGDPPAPGMGLVVSVSAKAKVNSPFFAMVVNQGATPIFLDPCAPAILQFNQDNQWEDYWGEPPRLPWCGEVSTLLVPPGNGLAIPFRVDTPTTYRVQVVFRTRCLQGIVQVPPACEDDHAMTVESAGFEVQ